MNIDREKARLRKRIADKQSLVQTLLKANDAHSQRELQRQRQELAGLERELKSLR